MDKRIKFCIKCGTKLSKWTNHAKICLRCLLVHEQDFLDENQFPIHLEVWRISPDTLQKEVIINPSRRKVLDDS